MAETPSPPSSPPLPRRELMFAGATLLAACVLVAVLVLFVDARLDAATLGLAATCAALLYALRGLFSIVNALARPHVELVLADQSAAGRAKAELRDESRRVLRAIKELDFDFGMGKLSKADYEQIREVYAVRAIELKRDLDDRVGLHPAVEALLAGTAVHDEGEPERAADAASRVCGSCSKDNDADAKFCKHCGKSLEAVS